MADIFISYAREDRSRIEPLAKSLNELGWTVFWDRTIPAGKTWRQEIGNALKNSRAVVVAWSKDSVESDWVQDEAEWGKKRNILIPVLIDEVDPPLGFGSIQAANLTNWNPTQSYQEFDKLIADISIILGPSPKYIRETGQAREEERRNIEENLRLEEGQKRAEGKRKAEKEGKNKQAGETEERTRKKKVERKTEPGKSTIKTIGLLTVLAVLFVAGVILFFKQELPRPRPDTPPSPPTPAKIISGISSIDFIIVKRRESAGPQEGWKWIPIDLNAETKKDGDPYIYLTWKPADTTDTSDLITSLAVFKSKDSKKAKNDLINEGYTIIDKDLNQGAGGDFIYLGYKKGENGKEPIRDLCITFDNDREPAQNKFARINIDLNSGAGGKFIYLWYSRN